MRTKTVFIAAMWSEFAVFLVAGHDYIAVLDGKILVFVDRSLFIGGQQHINTGCLAV